MDIRTCIQTLVRPAHPYLSMARVVAVQEAQATCTIALADGTELPNTRLRPLTDNKGALLMLPKVNSEVIVGFLSNAEAVVVGYSEVDKIQFNEGKYKGLVIAEKVKEELNGIKQSINDLKQLLTAWTPTPSDGGAALKTALTAWATQRLVPTQESNLYNDKITH